MFPASDDEVRHEDAVSACTAAFTASQMISGTGGVAVSVMQSLSSSSRVWYVTHHVSRRLRAQHGSSASSIKKASAEHRKAGKHSLVGMHPSHLYNLVWILIGDQAA